MALEKFLYFDRKPTNVCWNGTSFPINPKDIIECLPGFIKAFINEKWYKKVPADDTRPVKYTFPATPSFLTPDPMKGLPVRSTDKITSEMRGKVRPVVVLGDEPELNPYDLGVEDVVVDEKPRVVATTAIPKAAPTIVVPAPKVEEEKTEDFDTDEEETEETTVELDLPAPPDEKDVQVDPPEADQGPGIPLKSALRIENRDLIYDRMVGVRDAGCPLNPDMVDTFSEFRTKSTRGIMFKALWKYYGFDD